MWNCKHQGHTHHVRKTNQGQDHQDTGKDLTQLKHVMLDHHLEAEAESHRGVGISPNRDLHVK